MSPGADIDALLTPDVWEPGRCRVAQAIERVPDGRREQVAAAATDGRVSGPRFIQAVHQLVGDAPSETSLKRHRNGVCGCP